MFSRSHSSKSHSIERAMAAVGVAALWLVAPTEARAESQPQEPCCSIVRIDAASSIITARDLATGYTFRVEVKSPKLRASLKVGDKVWANYSVKRVRLGATGDSLCCAILETSAPAAPRKAGNP